MRRFLPFLAVAASAACATLPPFGPSIAAQAVPNDPHSATAESGAVRITAHPGDWSGYPAQLDDYVTPVELFVENAGSMDIAIRHDLFSLILPGGLRYEALTPSELRGIIGSAYNDAAAGYWYYGSFGIYPWPGLYPPRRPYHYPYLWWGDPWFDAGMLYAPPPPSLPPPVVSTPKGTLVPGGKVSVLVFFPIPVEQLGAFTIEAQVRGYDGSDLGTIMLPFERRTPAAPGARPAGKRPPPAPAPGPTPPAPTPPR